MLNGFTVIKGDKLEDICITKETIEISVYKKYRYPVRH